MLSLKVFISLFYSDFIGVTVTINGGSGNF